MPAISGLAPSLTNAGNNTRFAGCELGSPNVDYIYSLIQIINSYRKVIAVTSYNNPIPTHLTDSFFSNVISRITIGNMVYIVGNDFSQSGTTITTTGTPFVQGQNIIAEI